MRSTSRRLRAIALLSTALFASWPSAVAEAKSGVVIDEVTVPESTEGHADVAKKVRKHLRDAAKSVDFGNAEVTVHARVAEFAVREDGDVLRVTCTLVGELDEGPSARSHISFGGRLDERKKLEKQVLEVVARGVMARLAELARERSGSE